MRWMGFSTSQSPAEVMCSVSRSHTDRTCSEIRDRFSTRAEFPQPQPLGLERVRVGGVSASNEIALLLNPDAANPTLARAALSGGAPREVLEHVRDATWAPSGDRCEMVTFRFGYLVPGREWREKSQIHLMTLWPPISRWRKS